MSVTENIISTAAGQKVCPGQLVKFLADHVGNSAEKSGLSIESKSDNYYVFGKVVSSGYAQKKGGSRHFEAIVT